MGKILCALILFISLPACNEAPLATESTAGYESLRIAHEAYPRAYFFRASERPGRDPNIAYEEWEKSFSRLMGIEGKALDEEIPGLSTRNIDFFTRFKEAHPDQIVLLHFNGNARDPNWEAGEFFAGHWLYYNGADVLSDIPAGEAKTVIKVADASLFRMKVGRYANRNEDIGICEIDSSGKPNWVNSEQVKLLAVNEENSTITVERGAYGSTARSFKAGQTYAAAHVHEGQWGPPEISNLMWFYNYSTDCPRDSEGRTCVDVLIPDIVKRFAAGGELAAFDGVEFDVLRNTVRRPDKDGRGVDTNNDRKVDTGVVDGMNNYGLGVVEFCRRLRQEFPTGKLLLADGMSRGNQRAFKILNGIESEGFPHLQDIPMQDWSGGLNRHFFWEENARNPKFNYINHKFVERKPGELRPNYHPVVPFGVHRLVFAASVFTNAALCYSTSPETEPGEMIGIWDELQMGTEKKLGWLGRPTSPAVRLAETAPDLLQGQGRQIPEGFLAQFGGNDVKFDLDGGVVKITTTDPAARGLEFTLSGVPATGPDLYVTFMVKSMPPRGWPPEMARQLSVGIGEGPGKDFMTWTNADGFRPTFYFNDVTGSEVTLHLTIDGGEPLWISDMQVHAHPDAIYREFEHGLVLANPGLRPYAFDLAALFPGKSFRRLQGSPAQDPATNNGADVGGALELPGKDAIFLVAK